MDGVSLGLSKQDHHAGIRRSFKDALVRLFIAIFGRRNLTFKTLKYLWIYYTFESSSLAESSEEFNKSVCEVKRGFEARALRVVAIAYDDLSKYKTSASKRVCIVASSIVARGLK